MTYCSPSAGGKTSAWKESCKEIHCHPSLTGWENSGSYRVVGGDLGRRGPSCAAVGKGRGKGSCEEGWGWGSAPFSCERVEERGRQSCVVV